MLPFLLSIFESDIDQHLRKEAQWYKLTFDLIYCQTFTIFIYLFQFIVYNEGAFCVAETMFGNTILFFCPPYSQTPHNTRRFSSDLNV